MMTTDNSDQLAIEKTKEISSYLKHVTTLSTGSIVLIATLLNKIPSNPEGIVLIKHTTSAFLISIVGAVIAMTVNIAVLGRDTRSWEKYLGGLGLFAC